MPNKHHALFRHTLSFLVLGVFLLYVLLSGLFRHIVSLGDSVVRENPDFSKYIHSKTFPSPADHESQRIIIVGDIHGQYDYFQNLLSELHYDSSSSSNDTLIHAGDILAKGTVADSLRVLEWMTSRSILGVRGNHDQKVIDWKSWRDWIRRSDEGRLWLDRLDNLWEEQSGDVDEDEDQDEALDADDWVDKQRKKSHSSENKWWKKVPKGWKMFREHYLIASSLKRDQYDYLLSLPLILHLPYYHSFIAHAGLLPSDPTLSPSSPRQPLAHLPNPPMTDGIKDNSTLRRWQEVALLKDISQNNDPWIVLNMRSLLADNTITRNGKKGKPWSPRWNSMMKRCSGYNGFQVPIPEVDTSASPLPCLPSTIIYGHAAARGLDVKRWSFGLDSGCVYGRRLTALILQSPVESRLSSREDFVDDDDEEDEYVYEDEHEDEDDIDEDDSYDYYSRKRSVRFGDDNERLVDGYLIDVKCR